MMQHLSAALVTSAAVAIVTPLAAGQVQGDDSLKRETMARMLRPVELDAENTRLEDIVEFIRDVTGADLDPVYADSRNPIGLDPGMLVSVRSQNGTALRVIEKVLQAIDDVESGGADRFTWQMTPYGAMEFGPKERLERRKQTKVYDLTDLLFEAPDFQNAPQFDLNTVFQAGGQAGGGGGGGGGQSPFQQQQQQRDVRPAEERAQEVLDVIQIFAEPEDWDINGGSAARAQIYEQQLIVRAPDYVHRAIEGYSWWPRGLQQFAARENTERQGRRWLTLGTLNDDGEVARRRGKPGTVTATAGAKQ
ncbi:MAG: hypothetical protein AAGI17_06270 [Planctomycetota bacterium]